MIVRLGPEAFGPLPNNRIPNQNGLLLFGVGVGGTHSILSRA